MEFCISLVLRSSTLDGPAKQAILNSRTQSTALLAQAIAALPKDERPAVCVGASAIGLYPSGQDWHDEASPADEGFLADVVRAWESGVAELGALGLRTVSLRIGLVLSPRENAGQAVAHLSTRTWISRGQWRTVAILGARNRCAPCVFMGLNEPKAAGAYNVVAPQPVTTGSFAIAKACHRPFWAPRVPPIALKLVYGEMASVVLSSQRVAAERITNDGFAFQYTDLDEALADLV